MKNANCAYRGLAGDDISVSAVFQLLYLLIAIIYCDHINIDSSL